MPKISQEAAFASISAIHLAALLLGFCIICILITGSWTARVIVLALAGGFYAWVRWHEWRIRFRPNDTVLVTLGPHKGLRGTVVEPLGNGTGARVVLMIGDRSETVDFRHCCELRKVRSPRVARKPPQPLRRTS